MNKRTQNKRTKDQERFEIARKEGIVPSQIFLNQPWKESEGEYLGTGNGYAVIYTCIRQKVLFQVWQGVSAHRQYSSKEL